MKKYIKGLLVCLAIAVPSWFLGMLFPVIGGAVIAIAAGMITAPFVKGSSALAPGIRFASKKILQWAVVLLGFGMDLSVVLATGKQSLPILLCTIAVSLLIAFLLHRLLRLPSSVSILVGVGSCVCGGSAIAATAPVIDAKDEEVAQSMSVIFFFNVLAALIFPWLGQLLGFDRTSGEPFGIFAGTAVNDTSSVTAAASAWDAMWGLGSATLDTAVTVKLTRTLVIIPITLILAWRRTRKSSENEESCVRLGQIFPFFILYFIAASVLTTVLIGFGIPASAFGPAKELSKFLIVLALAAIGLGTDFATLIRTGGKPLVMGACCWIGITVLCLFLMRVTGIW